jgi:putative glutathione S-transferase
MGILIDGKWHDAPPNQNERDGRFVRKASAFRNWITADGSPGPSGSGGFAAKAGRYRLYVSLACPWAHRTLVFRVIKGLEEMLPVSVTHWLMAERGWTFDPAEGVIPDPVMGATALHQLYTRARANYSGRATVPVLWDTERDTIVSNESSEIIRMLNSAFDGIGAKPGDYYPAHLRDEIDALNDRVYDTLNNGVYKAGFASTQAAYEAAIGPLFETLDWLEARLARRRWLCGDELTEADWRLFTTLVRFDSVYHGHFKCNLRRLVDYPALWSYTRALYQWPGIARTVNLQHVKNHYYASHRSINPTGIVPVGPLLDFDQPAARP